MTLTTESGKIKSFDGTEIYYEVHGEGLPLILCYGVVCNMGQWKHQTKYFQRKYKVIHFDYRGHNGSQIPKDPQMLTIRGCAEDLYAVMKHLDIDDAVLLGHSMGVNVSFQFENLYPKKVLGLVAICGTVQNPFQTMFHTDFSQAGFEILKLLYIKFPNHFAKLWKKGISSPLSQTLTGLLGFNFTLTDKRDIKNYLEGVSNQSIDTFFYFLQEMADYKGEEIIKKIKSPTLIIGGENDLITPIKNQYSLYRKIKGSQFLKIPKGSHCAHVDMPDLVNLRVEKFLIELGY